VVSRERILAEILNEFEEVMKKVDKNPESVLESWRQRSKLIGEKIKIVDGDKEYFGVFEDIDDNGFLILSGRDGIKTIYNGDVSLR
jgi:biotin-(acetyl-CoA carboxylase) ligase